MSSPHLFKLSKAKLRQFHARRRHLEDTACDITLRVGDKSIGANKAFLALDSSDFQELFDKSGSETCFEMDDLSEVGLKTVIDFSISGEFSATLEDIGEVASAVERCKLTDALSLIESFIQGSKYDIDESTFLSVLKAYRVFGEGVPPKNLLQFALDRLLPAFEKHFFAQENYTNKLFDTDVAFFKAVLKEWEFRKQGLGEIAACDLIVGWIVRDFDQRQKYLNELVSSLKNVHEDVVQNVDDIMQFCKMSYSERRGQAKPEDVSLVTYMVIEPEYCTTRELFLTAYSLGLDRMKYLPMVPTCPGLWSDSAGMTVFDDKVYVCGEVSEETQELLYKKMEVPLSEGTFTGSMYQYDPCLDKWVQLTPMPTSRARLSLLNLGDKLFVIGGLNWKEEQTATVDIYDPKTDTWASGPPLPVALWEFGAAATEDGCLYVTGKVRGADEQQLFCYNGKKWSKKKSGIFVGFNFMMSYHLVSHKDSLYLFCGVNESSRITCDDNMDCSFVQHYDRKQDSWTRIDVMDKIPERFCFCAACCHDGTIYVWSRVNDPKRSDRKAIWLLNHISTFDPEKKRLTDIYEGEDDTMSGVMNMTALRFPKEVLERKRTVDLNDDKECKEYFVDHGRVDEGND